MGSKILSELGIDPGILLLVLLGLVVVYTVLMIFWIIRSRRVFHRYEVFMSGKKAGSLEDLVAELMDKVTFLQNQDMGNKYSEPEPDEYLSEDRYYQIQCIRRHGRHGELCPGAAGSE